jgi:tetratricopeptide (TPR) repeat protein
MKQSLLFAFFFVIFSGCAAKKEIAQLDSAGYAQYHNRGLALVNQGSYQAAQEQFIKALELNPSSLDSKRELALTYDELGDSCKAVALYNEVIAANPSDAIAYSNRGNSRWTLNDFSGSMSDLSRAIELDPKFMRAYRVRGDLRCWLQGKVGELNRAVQPADCLKPGLASGAIQTGPLQSKVNFRKLAMSDFAVALKLEPTSSEAFNSRGICYCRGGDKKRAREDFEKALALDPANEPARKNLTVALPKCGTF